MWTNSPRAYLVVESGGGRNVLALQTRHWQETGCRASAGMRSRGVAQAPTRAGWMMSALRTQSSCIACAGTRLSYLPLQVGDPPLHMPLSPNLSGVLLVSSRPSTINKKTHLLCPTWVLRSQVYLAVASLPYFDEQTCLMHPLRP